MSPNILEMFRENTYTFKVIYSAYKVDLKQNKVYREAKIKFRFSDAPDEESFREVYPEHVRKTVPEKWYITQLIDFRLPGHLYTEDLKETLELAKKDYLEWLKKQLLLKE